MPYRVFDEIEVRCPRLGGEVTFGYCRTVSDGLPCNRALICFERKFPVADYFRRVLRETTFRQCFEEPPPEDRYQSLLRTVSKTKKVKDRV